MIWYQNRFSKKNWAKNHANLRGVGVSRVLRLVVQDVSIYAKINRILSLSVNCALS